MAAAQQDACPRVVKGKLMGPLCRLMGSKGIDGDGTEFEVEHVDPFLYCDYVCLEGTELRKPPFCAHPHAGVAVASILCEGSPLAAWDNVHGFEQEKLCPGGVYVFHSGGGCVHDEGSDPVSLAKPSSAPFGLPGGERPAKNFRFFQLWFDAGFLHLAGDAPAVSSTVLRPDSVPTVAAGAMRVRVLLGRYADSVGVDVPATVLHGALLPFEGRGLVTIPPGSQGFLVAMLRSARVTLLGEEHVVGPQEELLLPRRASACFADVAKLATRAAPERSVGEPYDIALEPWLEGLDEQSAQSVKADDALEILLGFGVPSGKKFYKLLGYGGAVVAPTEEKARTLMREYEQDPRRFGIGKDAIPADSSRFGLQQGYKDPLDGKGECQRLDPEASPPEARFYELEKGPYQPKGKGKGK